MTTTTQRASFLSTSSQNTTTSSTTYPSTLSSLPPSALGLTDSPSQLARLQLQAQTQATKQGPDTALLSRRLHKDGSFTPLSQTQQLLSTTAGAKAGRPVSQSNLRASFTAAELNRHNQALSHSHSQQALATGQVSPSKVQAIVKDWAAKTTPQADRIITRRPVRLEQPESPTAGRQAARPASVTARPDQLANRPEATLRQQVSTSSLSSFRTATTDTSKSTPPPTTPTNGAPSPPVAPNNTPVARERRNPITAEPKPASTTPQKSASGTSTPVVTVHSDPRAVAVPRRPQSSKQPMKDRLVPQSSTTGTIAARPAPVQTDTRIADEWELELRKGVEQLRLSPGPEQGGQSDVARRRAMDEMWEQAGAWDMGKDAAREAEDRVRRETMREIARPPNLPRMPIRAAPSGVTSIHIGVRPRLHPSRANESLARNQPDLELPLPLFSPDPTTIDLPGATGVDSTVRGSYNTRYDGALADKAKAEYELWLSRKEEREGGVAGGEEYRAGEWEPKNRAVARPGAVEGIAHSDLFQERAQERAQASSMAAGGQQQHSLGQPNPTSLDAWAAAAAGGQNPAAYGYLMGYEGYGEGAQGFDPRMYGFWDPAAYWWAMQQAQAQGMPTDGTETGDPSAQDKGKGRADHLASDVPDKLSRKISAQDLSPDSASFGGFDP